MAIKRISEIKQIEIISIAIAGIIIITSKISVIFDSHQKSLISEII